MAYGEEDQPIYNEEEEFDYEEDEEEEEFDTLNNNPPITATKSTQNGDAVVDDEDDDVDVEHNDVDDSTSSSTFAAGQLSLGHILPHPFSTAGSGSSVKIGLRAGHDNDRIDGGVTIAATPISYAFMEEKKPAPAPIDESRRLFQRLWTDEDEIELLRSFLEYTSSRGAFNSSHHHDTAAFYGQVKSKFQLDFNKNQLVEKLRRLKKKYRTIMSKFSAGKEHVFKTPHEQVSFEISRKIWSDGGGGFRSSGGGGGGGTTALRGGSEEAGLDDEDGGNPDHNLPLIDQSPNLNLTPTLNGFDINHFDKKTPSSKKRSRSGLVKLEDKQLAYNKTMPIQKLQLSPQLNKIQTLAGMNAVPVSMVAPIAATVSSSFGEENPPLVATMAAPQPDATISESIAVENPPPLGTVPAPRTETTAPEKNPPPVATVSCSDTNGVEEKVKNCLSPIFKELLSNVMNMNGQMGSCSFRGSNNGLGFAFSPMPLGLNGEFAAADVKWRKQQILELEVYSKRLELVQDQIKSRLEELRSLDS